ncbi:MAG: hypothetical protein F4W90_06720 [Gammaproteobacteria bacterium]|nr:hypothetical protein [Gammaproteobacteria bacterium]
MNLLDFADRVGTLDVVLGLVAGIIAWTCVNLVGLLALNRYSNARATESNQRLAHSAAQAGIRLLATLLGIVVGFLCLWLVAN